MKQARKREKLSHHDRWKVVKGKLPNWLTVNWRKTIDLKNFCQIFSHIHQRRLFIEEVTQSNLICFPKTRPSSNVKRKFQVQKRFFSFIFRDFISQVGTRSSCCCDRAPGVLLAKVILINNICWGAKKANLEFTIARIWRSWELCCKHSFGRVQWEFGAAAAWFINNNFLIGLIKTSTLLCLRGRR